MVWVTIGLVWNSAALASELPQGPNLVFVLLDDVGYGDLGCYGGSHIRTPRLDALAQEGVRFTRYYANGPVCTPTRIALLTGLYPSRLGVRQAFGGSKRGIPRRVATSGEVLRRAGYVTAHIGKWHVGTHREEYLPSARFDHVVRYFGDYRDPRIQINDGADQSTEGHLTRILTDRALEFLETHAKQRFFLNLWYSAAHGPLDPPGEWARRYEDSRAGKYAALVSNVDEQIGRLLDRLQELGIAERTLVMVSSDNGTRDGSVGALQGSKSSLYEGGIRVPLVASWPGTLSAAVADAEVLSMDVMPTLAELAGIDSASLGIDGRSFLSVLRNPTAGLDPRFLVWEKRLDKHDDYVAREGPWKLLFQGGRRQLFHLAEDPAEQTDVAGLHLGRVRVLEDGYQSWRQDVGRLPLWDQASGTLVPETLTVSSRSLAVKFDPLLDVHDGDFSFTLTVRPGEAEEREVLAGRPGIWTLERRSQGKVQLVLRDEQDGRQTLRSQLLLSPEETTSITWTLAGTRKSGGVARLYLNGYLQEENRNISALPSSDAPLWIGGFSKEQGFRGTISGLRAYTLCLSGEEVGRLSRERSPR